MLDLPFTSKYESSGNIIPEKRGLANGKELVVFLLFG
jgi:hypothetical protein